MSAACVDTYVVSCTPAPKTPASEVVVVRTGEPELATTGGVFDPTGLVVGMVLVTAGLGVLVVQAVRALVRRAKRGVRS